MNYFDEFYAFINRYFSAGETETVKNQIKQSLASADWEKWNTLIKNLPDISPSAIDLLSDKIIIGKPSDTDSGTLDFLKNSLKQLMPWRKGPFELFGIFIDTEWRSDWKWNRLKDKIKPLEGKTVLDIGSGNGYFALKMLGAGAESVTGLDSYLLYTAQFLSVKKYLGNIPVWVIPLRFENFPLTHEIYDTVFSMGVLYHQKDPLNHLNNIHKLLKPGGELVLETLVINESYSNLLQPKGRYAKMRNVKNIPSISLLKEWLAENMYRDIRLIDVSKTTTGEQRKTEWMEYESFSDFLDPADRTKTIEGYPAPERAIVLAVK